tara:strand:+ start:172 stop:453 length:282 start_codon:yes stop_codon:yes gene_type:complete
MNINNWNYLKTFKDSIDNYEIIKVKPKHNSWVFDNGMIKIANDFKFVFKIKYIPTNYVFFDSWTNKNRVVEVVKEQVKRPKGYKTDYIFKEVK